MKFVALVALAVLASANAATSVAWGSAARKTSLVTGVAGGDLVVKFTPTTTVPKDGKVTITASAALFKTNAVTTCTVFVGAPSWGVRGRYVGGPWPLVGRSGVVRGARPMATSNHISFVNESRRGDASGQTSQTCSKSGRLIFAMAARSRTGAAARQLAGGSQLPHGHECGAVGVILGRSVGPSGVWRGLCYNSCTRGCILPRYRCM
jgi:hypothetical protein